RLRGRVLPVYRRIDDVPSTVEHRLESPQEGEVVARDEDPRAVRKDRRGRLELDDRLRRALVEDELLTFRCGDDAKWQARRGDPRLGGGDELVDARVVAIRVVMEQDERLHPRRERDVDGVLDRAVTPSRLRGDVAAGVLRVVHDDVRALQELGVTLV